MNIHYLNCRGQAKLFSFFTHDYKEIEIDGKFYMLDGGFDYIRSSGEGTIERKEINEIIEDIRNSFKWGQNFDKNNVRLKETKYALLKDLSTSHIIGILQYFNNRAYKFLLDEDVTTATSTLWHITQYIFLAELKYREEKNEL